jgi:hypothetical protein
VAAGAEIVVLLQMIGHHPTHWREDCGGHSEQAENPKAAESRPGSMHAPQFRTYCPATTTSGNCRLKEIAPLSTLALLLYVEPPWHESTNTIESSKPATYFPKSGDG